MKRQSLITIALLLTAGCVHESAIPLGNDMAQIDISAAPVYGRAGAERIAMENAAKITLKMGYDKFVVVNNTGWNETTLSAGGYSQGTATLTNAQASSGEYAATHRNPEAKMIIRMFHDGDKGAKKAIDAKTVLELNQGN